MKKQLVILLISVQFVLSFGAYAGKTLVVPLTYMPLYGIYTTGLKVGDKPKQIIDVIVDTGSSSLLLLGDTAVCSNCKKPLTKKSLKLPTVISQQKVDKIAYGSSLDEVIPLELPVQFAAVQEKQFPINSFVIKKSTQPSSILGLIHYDMRSNIMKFVPFLDKITENFKKYSNISFLLCGDRGYSYLFIGNKKFPHVIGESRLTKSYFYEISVLGFYGEDGTNITPGREYKAILDTGTGGFILLTEKLYKNIRDHIYQNSGKQNQRLNKDFWDKNYCIKTKDVDFKTMPLVKIGLKGVKGDYYLNIPPQTYLNSGGCGDGYVRLVFTKGLPLHASAKRNAKKRQELNALPDIVLGTSLLEKYPFTLDFKNTEKVIFYKENNLCSKVKKKNAKMITY